MSASRSIRVAAVIAVVGLSPFARAETVTLRVQPKKGQTFRYGMTQEQTARVSLGEMGSQETAGSTRIDFHQTAADLTDTTVTFEAVYDRVRTETRAGGETTSFDTDTPPNPDGAQAGGAEEVLGGLVGKTLRVTVDRRGLVRSVEGFDAILEEILAEAGDDPATRPMMDLLRESFGDEAAVQSFQQSTAVLPEEPVTEGSTWAWKADVANPAVGTMKLDYRFRLEGFEEKRDRRCARVAMTFTLDYGGEMPLLEELRRTAAAQGQEMDIDVDLGRSEGSGTLWLDVESGMAVVMESTMGMKMTMKLTVVAPDSPEAGGSGGTFDLAMDMTLNQAIEMLGN